MTREVCVDRSGAALRPSNDKEIWFGRFRLHFKPLCTTPWLLKKTPQSGIAQAARSMDFDPIVITAVAVGTSQGKRIAGKLPMFRSKKHFCQPFFMQVPHFE